AAPRRPGRTPCFAGFVNRCGQRFYGVNVWLVAPSPASNRPATATTRRDPPDVHSRTRNRAGTAGAGRTTLRAVGRHRADRVRGRRGDLGDPAARGTGPA